MASILVRNLHAAVKERLRARAARNGVSMEAEARRILQSALMDRSDGKERNLYERVRARFEPLGGVELETPSRELPPAPPLFE